MSTKFRHHGATLKFPSRQSERSDLVRLHMNSYVAIGCLGIAELVFPAKDREHAGWTAKSHDLFVQPLGAGGPQVCRQERDRDQHYPGRNNVDGVLTPHTFRSGCRAARQ